MSAAMNHRVSFPCLVVEEKRRGGLRVLSLDVDGGGVGRWLSINRAAYGRKAKDTRQAGMKNVTGAVPRLGARIRRFPVSSTSLARTVWTDSASLSESLLRAYRDRERELRSHLTHLLHEIGRPRTITS